MNLLIIEFKKLVSLIFLTLFVVLILIVFCCRVSFGSSKGSMVETLIYESPLQEEPETSPNTPVPSDGTDDSSIVG